MTESDLKQVVKEKCGAAARRDADIGRAASCCGSAETASSSCCATGSLPGADPITGDLDDSIQTAELPEAAVPASLGCGNPIALAELRVGEIVLDLDSARARPCGTASTFSRRTASVIATSES